MAMRTIRFILCCLLLAIFAGCQPGITPQQPSTSLQGAGNSNASVLSDIESITREATAAKPHADAIGQALIDQVLATATEATKKTTATAAALDAANADAAAQKKADDAAFSAQKADYEKKLAKAKSDAQAADGHAFATHMLYILAIIGVPIFAFAVVLMIKSATTWGKSLAAGSAVLSLASVGLALTINVLETVSPIFAYCICAVLVVCTVGACVVLVIEVVKRSKAIVAQHADSAGNKQPGVSYSPDVAKVLKKVLTPAIGSVAAEAAVDPVSVTSIGNS